MYLSKLEIFGFKSFANKTTVTFTPGLTAVVGPNGCGKTNIVDAIRWCLGEQKSSTLRSDKMENVIFNGTSQKKPMGMSEVSLTIVNDKGLLPSDYSEVVITRRIFRSGESEYLLNKNICRLKDITNLFMDTGMGANAYSVIELKMVEMILGSKTDDRRNMFEEAAGVNKYKLRRRLTLKKLEDVKGDLNRVNDIVSEVEKKVASLERQAKKADKANQLKEQITNLELEYSEKLLSQMMQSKLAFEDKRAELTRQKDSMESELVSLDEQLSSVREELYETEAALKHKRIETAAHREKMFKVEQQISISQERKKSLSQNIDKYNRELEELGTQLEITEDSIIDSEEKIIEFEHSIKSKLAEKEELKLKVESSKTALENKKFEVKAVSQESIEQFKQLNSKQNDLQNLERAIKRIEGVIEKSNTNISRLSTIVEQHTTSLSELSTDKSEVELSLAEAEEDLARQQNLREELEAELKQLTEQELQERGVINEINSKISFLKSLIDNLDGISKGTKSLLDDSSWNNDDKQIIANLGTASEEYKFAVEAAIKNNLSNIVVNSLSDIKSAIERLEANSGGKASFYLLDTTEIKKSFVEKLHEYFDNKKKKKLESSAGFLGWAHQFVQVEQSYRKVFTQLLEQVAVASDLQTAFSLRSIYPSIAIVTLQGDYLSPTGVIEAGALPQLDDTIFGRKTMLDSLSLELPPLESKLEALRAKIADVEQQISSIDLRTLADDIRTLFNDLASVEKKISQKEFEKSKAAEEKKHTESEIEENTIQLVNLQKEHSELSVVIEHKLKEKEEVESRKSALEINQREFEAVFNSSSQQLNSLSIEIERKSGEKKNAENLLLRNRESITTITATIDRRKKEIESATLELSTLDDIVSDSQFDYDELLLVRDKIAGEEKVVEDKYKEIRTNIQDLERQVTTLRKRRDDVGNQIHSFDISLKEIAIKVENLYKHIQQKYVVQLEIKEFDDLDTFPFSQRETEINQMEKQLMNLGPINSLAYEEWDEERNRLEFLHKQRNDLFDSEKDLIKTIEEINTTAQNLFMETFEKIRINFIRVFQSLFNPGDECDLILEEADDPLEGNIQIIAKPKGKRPTNIELLSGGEKTLTAIALLFAIYLVKPSPFCILDEVDAPLDDSNVGRFTKIIKEFTANTQFITVTHNKGTMEAADILYGVTMQEEGVSKIVSVKFNEDLQFD